MESKVEVKGFKTVHPICTKCKGTCYVPKNSKKTQDNVRKAFGVVLDKCVDNSLGTTLCPYHQ